MKTQDKERRKMKNNPTPKTTQQQLQDKLRELLSHSIYKELYIMMQMLLHSYDMKSLEA